MMKRGQVTLFILVGIVIVIVLMAGYYAKIKLTEREPVVISEESSLTEEEREAVHTVEECLEQKTGERLLLILQRGGYLQLPENSFNEYFLQAPILASERDVPTLEQIAENVRPLLELDVLNCQGDFNILGDANAKIRILETKVRTELEMPLELADKRRLEDFDAEINIGVPAIRSTAIEIFHAAQEGHLTKVLEIAQESGVLVSNGFYSGMDIYALTFDRTINDQNITFVFALNQSQGSEAL